MKKIISLCLALILVFFVFTVAVFAENESEENTVVVSVDPEAWGDLNGDREVTSADARICLRAAAKLESLTEEQRLAADIYGDGEISARNARKILRVAAKLDIFDCYTLNVKLRQGESLRIENLIGGGKYNWEYILQSSDPIAVERKSFEVNPTTPDGEPITGGPSNTSFTFTPQTLSIFDIKMVYKVPWLDNNSTLYGFVLKVDMFSN